MVVRLSQSIYRHAEIDNSIIGCIRQNAECAEDIQMPTKRFLAAVPVVDQQSVSPQFLSQRDRFQFSRSERDRRPADLVRTAHLQPTRRALEPVADGLRSFVAAEFSDDRRRHDHPAVQRRQDVLALDQNQVLQRRGVGDDNHSKSRSAAWVGELSLALLSQLRTGVALTLEVLNGVFEGDAVALEEGVQIIPRWDVEELAHLNPSHPVRPVRFCGERFHGRP